MPGEHSWAVVRITSDGEQSTSNALNKDPNLTTVTTAVRWGSDVVMGMLGDGSPGRALLITVKK